MHRTTCRFFLRQMRNVKWTRKLSSNVIKLDEFTIASAIPSKPTPRVRLIDYIWVSSSGYKDKVAVISAETKKAYTYSQLQKSISVFATSLQEKLCLQPNDIVAIALPNCPEYPVVAFGTIQAGCIVTPINPAYKSYELLHQLKVTKPKVVVTIPQVYKTILTALREAEVHAKIVVIDNPSQPVPDGVVRYTEIAEQGNADHSLLDRVEKTHDDVAVLPFSSGTTGLPKGVQITYKNLIASLEFMRNENHCLPSVSTETHQDILTCVLPFFHIYGMVVLMMGHLSVGCKLITNSAFNPEVYLKTLKSEKNTLLYVVPPLLTFLGKMPMVTKEYFENLKYIFCGAAPISASDIGVLMEKVNPKTEFIQGYALTETTSTGCVIYKGSGNMHLGSCGDPGYKYEVRFADPDKGTLVPIGEAGEVMMRSPCVMSGYYQNAQATEECMTDDGFFKTGDLGVYKPDEGLYILGRLKELIKVKGLQVTPAELEGILRSHTCVSDAAVIGIPHEYYGEVPKAFVVLNHGKSATSEELKEFVAAKVSSFKKIHEVVFVDAIPKNAAGKILRKELMKM